MKKFIPLLSLFLILPLSGCSSEVIRSSVDTKTEPEIVATTLSTQEILDLAYLDELKAEATYTYIIEKFGEQQPFINIINAEIRHSQSIFNLYKSFELTAPEFKNIPTPKFDSIKEACNAGVIAEKENIELYDELMAQITEHNIISVFKNLQSASQEKHLPAFERCSK